MRTINLSEFIELLCNYYSKKIKRVVKERDIEYNFNSEKNVWDFKFKGGGMHSSYTIKGTSQRVLELPDNIYNLITK